MTKRRREGAVILYLLRELGTEQFCWCGATLLNFDVMCRDVLGEGVACPGWQRMSRAANDAGNVLQLRRHFRPGATP